MKVNLYCFFDSKLWIFLAADYADFHDFSKKGIRGKS